jgi:hypothetical protein
MEISSTIIRAALAVIATVSTATAGGPRIALTPSAMPVVDGDLKVTAGFDVTASIMPFRLPERVDEAAVGLELQVSGTYFPDWDATLLRATLGVSFDQLVRVPKVGPFGGLADAHFMFGPTIGRFWRDGVETVVGGTMAGGRRLVSKGPIALEGFFAVTLLLARGERQAGQPSHSIFGIDTGFGLRLLL